MLPIAEALKAYTRNHPFDAGSGDAETVLDQLFQAYCESHESDPPEISEGFKELECFLESLPLSDNNAVFRRVSLADLMVNLHRRLLLRGIGYMGVDIQGREYLLSFLKKFCGCQETEIP